MVFTSPAWSASSASGWKLPHLEFPPLPFSAWKSHLYLLSSYWPLSFLLYQLQQHISHSAQEYSAILSCLSKQCFFCLPERSCWVFSGSWGPSQSALPAVLFTDSTKTSNSGLPTPLPQGGGAGIPRKHKLTSQSNNLIMKCQHFNRKVSF